MEPEREVNEIVWSRRDGTEFVSAEVEENMAAGYAFRYRKKET
jgi:hypothetical protein